MKGADTAPGIENSGKEIFLRDVIVFIDRIRDVARIRRAKFVRGNLQPYLREEALEWYTSQLTDREKLSLTYSQALDKWVSFLIERFRLTKSMGMSQLLKEKYTINDALRYREPRKFAMSVVRTAKIAKLDVVHNQLEIIWNGLDVDPLELDTTLNQFLGEVATCMTEMTRTCFQSREL